jgi:hypothetical protein
MPINDSERILKMYINLLYIFKSVSIYHRASFLWELHYLMTRIAVTEVSACKILVRKPEEKTPLGH